MEPTIVDFVVLVVVSVEIVVFGVDVGAEGVIIVVVVDILFVVVIVADAAALLAAMCR